MHRIERAMKSHRQGASHFNQIPCPFNVDTSAALQNSQHDAIHAELLRGKDVVAHNFKFAIGVTEISCPWTNQNMDGNAQFSPGGLHQSRSRSDSTAAHAS